jgi:colanic acid/amylovoran biosynthesis protein
MKTPGSPLPPTVLLLGARLGTGNMGVGALATGMATVARAAYPDARLFILDYDDEPAVERFVIAGAAIEVPVINMRFSKNPFVPGHILPLLGAAVAWRTLPMRRFRSFIEKHLPVIGKIATADLCLSIAGGDSFADLYGILRYAYVALPQALCLILRRPFVHMPQTYGPFRNPIVRWTASLLFAGARAVFSRDLDGVSLVNSLPAVRKKGLTARFSHDVAFVMEPRRSPIQSAALDGFLAKNSSRVVGINISGLLWMGGYTGNNMFGLNISYPDFTRRLIDFFITTRGLPVLLIAHTVAVGKSREADDGVCRAVFDELKDRYGNWLFFDPAPYDQNEIKYIIGNLSFLVAARMHACIAALSQEIPAIGVAYSKKFAGVLSSIGVGDLVIDPSRQTENELMHSVAALFDRRKEFADVLHGTMPKVKDQVLGLLKGIPL